MYAQIGVLGVSGVLLGAFWVQFGEGECPCLLCLLQRMAMMLTVMGPVFVIAHVQGFSVQRLGYGISIFEQLGFGD